MKSVFIRTIFLICIGLAMFQSCRGLYDNRSCQEAADCMVGEFCSQYSLKCERYCSNDNHCFDGFYCAQAFSPERYKELLKENPTADNPFICTPVPIPGPEPEPQEESPSENSDAGENRNENNGGTGQDDPSGNNGQDNNGGNTGQDDPPPEPIIIIKENGEKVIIIPEKPPKKDTKPQGHQVNFDWWTEPKCSKCEAGGIKCIKNDIHTCQEDPDPCKRWKKTASCKADEVCHRGSCVKKTQCTGPKGWPFYLNSSSHDRIDALLMDKNDNLFVTGWFTVDMNLPSATGANIEKKAWAINDLVLLKVDKDGNTKLVKTYPTDDRNEEKGWNLLFNKDGDLLVNLSITGAIKLNDKVKYQGIRGDDILLMQLDPENFNLKWSMLIGGTHTDFAYTMALDADGNILLGGEFRGTFEGKDKDGKSTKVDAKASKIFLASDGTGLGTRTAFLTKIDPKTKRFLWIKTFGTNFADKVNSVKVDSKGNIWVTGLFANLLSEIKIEKNYEQLLATGDATKTIEFVPGEPIKSHGESDAFVLKLDKDGKVLKVIHFGGKKADVGFDLAITKDDGVLVYGRVSADVTFTTKMKDDSAIPKPAKWASSMILKLDNEGKGLWVKYVPDGCVPDTYDTLNRLFLDDKENIYFPNCFGGGFKLEGKDRKSRTLSDLHLLKLAADGSSFLWDLQFGVKGRFRNTSFALDSKQNLFFASGLPSQGMKGINMTVQSMGAFDAFIKKFTPDGKELSYCKE